MNIFFEQLLEWYHKNHRDLPWRNTRDPYKIWVSEIMLQQTRVAQVIDFYMTFLNQFPRIEDLANSDDITLLKVWQGLGYYSRALNMRFAARQIVEKHNGIFPSDFDAIRALKGLGDYSAAAVGSIAFGIPKAAVDGNVKRVASRFFGIDRDIQKPQTVREMTDLLNEMIGDFPPSEFNQSLIELGALVCVPVSPGCEKCPLQGGCFAFSNQVQKKLPVKGSRKKPVKRYLEYVFIDWKGHTYVRQRDHTGIWKGLFEFPSLDSVAENHQNKPSAKLLGYFETPESVQICGYEVLEHQLTHQTIFATFWHISGKPSIIVNKNNGFIKITKQALSEYPVHRLMQRYMLKTGLEKEKHT